MLTMRPTRCDQAKSSPKASEPCAFGGPGPELVKDIEADSDLAIKEFYAIHYASVWRVRDSPFSCYLGATGTSGSRSSRDWRPWKSPAALGSSAGRGPAAGT